MSLPRMCFLFVIALAIFRVLFEPPLKGHGDAPILQARQEVSIAVVTYSFGGFRDELQKLRMETIYMHPEYDWHFFIDERDQVLKLQRLGWTVHFVNPAEDTLLQQTVTRLKTNSSFHLTESVSRLYSKWYKFGHVPAVLRRYGYLLHLDLSVFGANGNRYPIPSPSTLQSLLRLYPDAALFFCEHKKRRTVEEEFLETVERDMELPSHVLAFEQNMVARFGVDVVQRMPIFETGLFFRRLDAAPLVIDRVMADVFEKLIEYGLQRDQNVLTFSLFDILKGSVSALVCTGFRRPLSKGALQWPLGEVQGQPMRIALLMSGTANRFELASMVKGATHPLVSEGHTVDHYLALGLQNQFGWQPHVGSFVGDPVFGHNFSQTQVARMVQREVERAGGKLRQLDLFHAVDLDSPDLHLLHTKLRDAGGVEMFPHTYSETNHPRAKFANQNWLRTHIALEKLWDGLETVENAEGWQYDYVMFLRDDTYWIENVSLHRLLERGPEADIYALACDAREPPLSVEEMCDHILIASRSSAPLVGRLFNSTLTVPVKRCISVRHKFCNPEMFLKWYLTEHAGLSILEVPQRLLPIQRVGRMLIDGTVQVCFHKHCRSKIGALTEPDGMQFCKQLLLEQD